jgi:hypothetical protein
MGLGFLPSIGVVSGLANNAYQATHDAVADCIALYYPRGRCKLPIDTDALNGLASQLLCIIDKAGLGYDCNNLCQTAQAVPLLVVRCFSQLGITAPPTSEVTPLLFDDTMAGAAANGGIVPIWGWDCRTGAYVMLNGASGIRYFSVLGITTPPPSFVSSFLIDDTLSGASGNKGVPPLWVWNYRASAYSFVNPQPSYMQAVAKSLIWSYRGAQSGPQNAPSVAWVFDGSQPTVGALTASHLDIGSISAVNVDVFLNPDQNVNPSGPGQQYYQASAAAFLNAITHALVANITTATSATDFHVSYIVTPPITGKYTILVNDGLNVSSSKYIPSNITANGFDIAYHNTNGGVNPGGLEVTIYI